MVEIRTTRLLMRHWVAADRQTFADLNADPEVMEFLPGPLTREQSDALADRCATRVYRLGYGRSRRVMQRIGLRFVERFDHPGVPAASPLRAHVLYGVERRGWDA